MYIVHTVNVGLLAHTIISSNIRRLRGVVQLVECAAGGRVVAGSSPVAPTNFFSFCTYD